MFNSSLPTKSGYAYADNHLFKCGSRKSLFLSLECGLLKVSQDAETPVIISIPLRGCRLERRKHTPRNIRIYSSSKYKVFLLRIVCKTKEEAARWYAELKAATAWNLEQFYYRDESRENLYRCAATDEKYSVTRIKYENLDERDLFVKTSFAHRCIFGIVDMFYDRPELGVICRGLRYLHSHGIAHGNISLRTIASYEDGTIWGIQILSLAYETDSQKDFLKDLFALGIVLFQILIGSKQTPDSELLEDEFSYDPFLLDLVSEEASDLVRKLIGVKMDGWFDINEVLGHAWFKE